VITVPEKPDPRRWRKYLRFSVRGLILLVLITGGWLGWIVRSARIQHDAVRALSRAGASAFYEWEWKDGEQLADGAPPWPKRLVTTLGVDYFGTVVAVMFTSEPLLSDEEIDRLNDGHVPGADKRELVSPSETDAALAHVSALTRLRWLKLTWTKVTDVGLVHLRGLSSLETLDLEYNKITDSGLEQLRRVRSLKDLNIASSRVTDAGLAHLEGLTRLETLNLLEDRITDKGLEHLKHLTNLKDLNLCYTLVTDKGLVHLKGLINLEKLCLANCPGISDAGLVNLKGLKRLQWLHLDGSKVTDAGLVHLEGLVSLTYLGLMDTKVTDSGVKKLQQVLPDAEIVISIKTGSREG